MKQKKLSLLIGFFVMACLAAMILSACNPALRPFDATRYEQFFTAPYVLEGNLKFSGASYRIRITRDAADCTGIFFYDGEITEGLTVSFDGDDVFISFDDLRFKTNAAIFTDLRNLNTALTVMEHSMYPKRFTPADTSSGSQPVDVLTAQIGGGTVSLYVNPADGRPLRIQSDLNGVSMFVDITSIVSVNPEHTTAADYTTQQMPEVVTSIQ